MDNYALSNHPTPSQPPTRHVARGPVSRHPSNGGELGTFPPRSKFPFTTDMAAAPVPLRNKVPHLAEGCPIPGPAKMQFSWVVGPGWLMPPPKSGRITIIRRIGRMNAHRPRAPRKHSLRGWNPGGGCRAPRDGGWGTRVTSNELRVTSNSAAVIAKEYDQR